MGIYGLVKAGLLTLHGAKGRFGDEVRLTCAKQARTNWSIMPSFSVKAEHKAYLSFGLPT